MTTASHTSSDFRIQISEWAVCRSFGCYGWLVQQCIKALTCLMVVGSLSAEELKWSAPKSFAAPSQLEPLESQPEVFRLPVDQHLEREEVHELLPSAPAAPLNAEVTNAPPGPFDPLGYYLAHADDTFEFIEEWERTCQPIVSPITPGRPGFFQEAGLSGSWTDGTSEGRAPSMTDVSGFAVFALPFPIEEWPLYITKGFDVRFLDGPQSPDLPPILYDSYLDFTWKLQVTRRSTQIFSVAPGVYGDTNQSFGDAFRVTGKWVGTYDVVKHRIIFMSGIVYVGREDIKSLSVYGLIFTPNDWSRIEAVYPNPRVSLRLRANERHEDWLYTGADFKGGQTWAIDGIANSVDKLTITENRTLIGYERRKPGGAGWHVEAGWIFNRQVRLRNDPSNDFAPDETYYVRAGFTL